MILPHLEYKRILNYVINIKKYIRSSIYVITYDLSIDKCKEEEKEIKNDVSNEIIKIFSNAVEDLKIEYEVI